MKNYLSYMAIHAVDHCNKSCKMAPNTFNIALIIDFIQSQGYMFWDWGGGV